MKLVIEFKFRLVLSTIGVIFEFLIVRYLNMTPTSTQLLTPPPPSIAIECEWRFSDICVRYKTFTFH